MTDKTDKTGKNQAYGPRVRDVPEGDDRLRLMCPDCGYIAYENPKIVVGTVCTYNSKILLCKRAIEPRTGYWTMPAGYMELEETTMEGAHREAYEEAGIDVSIGPLLAIYNLPHINQVQIFYRGSLETNHLDPGPETQEAQFFDWNDIPWENLAFPTVKLALLMYEKTKSEFSFVPDQQVIQTRHLSAL